MACAMIKNKTSFGRIAWFSGGTKGRLVVAERVQRKDYRKLTASEGGGVIRVRHSLRPPTQALKN